MTERQILEQLTQICEKVGLEIRFEHLASSGGVCELRGHKTLFVGTACSVQEQIGTICEALMDQDLDELYILPEVRETIENEKVRIRAGRAGDAAGQADNPRLRRPGGRLDTGLPRE